MTEEGRLQEITKTLAVKEIPAMVPTIQGRDPSSKKRIAVTGIPPIINGVKK